MWLFVPLASEMSLDLVSSPSATTDGVVRLTTSAEQPLLNRVNLQVVDRRTRKVVASHLLDFNKRLGYAATSTESLDTVDATKPYIAPQGFDSSGSFTTDIVIPQIFIGPYTGGSYRATFTAQDIWGNTVLIRW